MDKGKKIIVFGSYITDLTARVTRFPQAGETVFGDSFRYGPGGKGSNQAVAAHRAGADVSFITRVGSDYFGDFAKQFYRQEAMPSDGFIVDEACSTGAALISVEQEHSQNEIVVIPGACAGFCEADLKNAEEQLDGADILVTQLETNLDAVEHMLRAAKRRGLLTILNPAPACGLSDAIFEATDILVPNETEAELLTGRKLRDDMSNASELAGALMEKKVGKVIITLGSHGYYACDGQTEQRQPAHDFRPVVDTTGAGDAFIGGFCAGLARGLDFFDAARFANVASSLAVTRSGTAPAMAREDEILRYYNEEQKNQAIK